MVTRSLSSDEIKTIQQLRYEGKSNREIMQAVPKSNDSLIGTYAPSELRGAKRRLLEYIREHPGIDYKDIPFWKEAGGPTKVGGQLRDLSRAGFITYKERAAAPINGHGTRGSDKSGFFDIHITNYGIRRLDAGFGPRRTKITPQERIADKLQMFPIMTETPITETPKVDQFGVAVDDIVEDESENIVEDEPMTAEDVQTAQEIVEDDLTIRYPILSKILRRHKASREAAVLLEKVAALYDDVDLTIEAITALEALKSTPVKFEAWELEYMKFWEACNGITDSNPRSTETS